MNGKIAERAQGRIAGAIKQVDEDDVLGDPTVEEIAEVVALSFEREVRRRMSVQAQESLEGESDGDE